MTDWFSLVESIHAAMQAVDKAHEATESLREKADREAVEKFQLEMQTLSKHLEQMQQILAHEDTYTIDELAEALSATLGTETSYHRIAKYEINQKPPD